MRIKVHCQNRIGILRDILNLLVEYGVNVAKGEVGGEHGNAIYLYCPNLVNLQFQALRPQFEAIAGVFGVKRVGLMPSERRHMELNALLGALEFPVLSIDMGGSIVAANRAAAQLLGVRVDEVPGIPLSRYAEDFDLPELVRASKSRINGLRVKVKGDVFLADIAPLQSSEHDDSEAMAGAVLTLHRADRVGERIYNVRKQELRGFDSIFQSSRVMAAVVREARRMAPLDGGTVKAEHIRLPDYGVRQPLGDFSLEGGLEEIVGRFEKAVLAQLYAEHPSSRLLGKRLGVSHTTIANKLRDYEVVKAER
eukprot:gene20455-24299_t